MPSEEKGPPPRKQERAPLRVDQLHAPEDAVSTPEIEDHPEDIGEDQPGTGLGPI